MVPSIFLNNPDKLHSHDEELCTHPYETHTLTINNIKGKPASQKRWILMIFPDGCCVSTNFGNSIPVLAEKVYPSLYTIAQDIAYGKHKTVYAHQFLPLAWKFCIVKTNCKMLELESADEDDIFERVTKGIKGKQNY
eukprot:12372359-Ditylum_brightwellii.AAC.1